MTENQIQMILEFWVRMGYSLDGWKCGTFPISITPFPILLIKTEMGFVWDGRIENTTEIGVILNYEMVFNLLVLTGKTVVLDRLLSELLC